jgi:hypothetical protein
MSLAGLVNFYLQAVSYWGSANLDHYRRFKH